VIVRCSGIIREVVIRTPGIRHGFAPLPALWVQFRVGWLQM